MTPLTDPEFNRAPERRGARADRRADARAAPGGLLGDAALGDAARTSGCSTARRGARLRRRPASTWRSSGELMSDDRGPHETEPTSLVARRRRLGACRLAAPRAGCAPARRALERARAGWLADGSADRRGAHARAASRRRRAERLGPSGEAPARPVAARARRGAAAPLRRRRLRRGRPPRLRADPRRARARRGADPAPARTRGPAAVGRRAHRRGRSASASELVAAGPQR